ncbi:acyl-coenzyme A amino acid N-acyltransferase 1-like [Octopus vulgaris]|uniref:Acyl-coenzyme A amino acid N-acyltransferase 1-like n=1 Tax=Octopus vulgaris TaxID=6645 RepID=A0AA36C0N0_OCTVU|nr:acyl-coenzyme A amino acid N-acyltransferase 1-like [Octopus vulgaris]
MILRPSYQLLSALRHIPSYRTFLSRALVSVTVNPENGLVDEQVSVSVSGLRPEENVTVSATIEQSSKKRETVFRSFGHFKASVDGCVNLVTDPCLAGTYTGIDPMGLFWSMTQAVGKHGRIMTHDATKSLDYTMMVHPGHISQHSDFSSDIKPLATKLVQRSFMRSGVRKITVNYGRLRGSLFIPSDETTNRQQRRRYPAVIDLFGSTGSLIESRGALLASNGFITLSLAYFAYKDLPSVVNEVDFEYFEEAIDYLINHEQVSSEKGIGVLGTSLGGVIALYMAKECPQVSAAISINATPTFFVFSIRHNGKQVPYCCSIDCGHTVYSDDGCMITNWKTDESKLFYLDESSRSKVLFFISGDDPLLYADDYYMWLKNLTPAKKKDVEFIIYEGAGHLLEPPYTPLFNSCYSTYFRGPAIFGGYPRQHAEAQEKSWLKIREFFTENL